MWASVGDSSIKEVSYMTVKKWEKSDGATIEIDHEKCTGAGECVEVCPAEVFELVNGKSEAPGFEECFECCACVTSCPVEAIVHSSC